MRAGRGYTFRVVSVDGEGKPVTQDYRPDRLQRHRGRRPGDRGDGRLMRSVELRVSSGHGLVTDLTSEAASFVADQADGLLSVFVPHATAGVALIETGAGTEPDLADALERLLRPRTSTGIAMAAWGTVATT